MRERASARDARIKALQGEKDAVAYVAYKVQLGDWNRYLRNERFRNEAITALCLAFVFQKSDRAKTLVYSALTSLRRTYRGSIVKVLGRLEGEMLMYRAAFRPDKDFDDHLATVRELTKKLSEEPYNPRA